MRTVQTFVFGMVAGAFLATAVSIGCVLANY
jgi:hypothetical protein